MDLVSSKTKIYDQSAIACLSFVFVRDWHELKLAALVHYQSLSVVVISCSSKYVLFSVSVLISAQTSLWFLQCGAFRNCFVEANKRLCIIISLSVIISPFCYLSIRKLFTLILIYKRGQSFRTNRNEFDFSKLRAKTNPEYFYLK